MVIEDTETEAMEDTETEAMEDTETKDMEDTETKDMEVTETKDTEIGHIIRPSSILIQQRLETALDSEPETQDRMAYRPLEWQSHPPRTVEVPSHPETVSPHLIHSADTTPAELATASLSANKFQSLPFFPKSNVTGVCVSALSPSLINCAVLP